MCVNCLGSCIKYGRHGSAPIRSKIKMSLEGYNIIVWTISINAYRTVLLFSRFSSCVFL